MRCGGGLEGDATSRQNSRRCVFCGWQRRTYNVPRPGPEDFGDFRLQIDMKVGSTPLVMGGRRPLSWKGASY